MEIRDKLSEVGLKSTPQRRLVYEIMQNLCHANIDEIIQKVQSVSPNITLSTIYRILDSFCTVGLLSKIDHPSGKTFFDKSSSEHYHIITSNNKIIDFEDSELSVLIRERIKDSIDPTEEIQRISIQIVTKKKIII